MELYLKYIIFVSSFLLLGLILVLVFIVGKKQGLKKALYKISYRAICIIFSLLLAPYVNEYLLNYDLYSQGKSIKYNGMYFYRLIDFFEEIIVHNEILNDIYTFVPSLKNLLMDFPQVLFVPFTYVLTFIFISIALLPLYWYLSYKREKRVLYERPYKSNSSNWAGVLNAAQFVLLISVLLTPISGLTRAYKDISEGLVEDDSNICLQSKYIEKYDLACKVVVGYNSSVLGLIGSSPINKHIYNSLTRINYDDKKTSLDQEIVSIARAGIVLNKTGILEAIEIESFDDVTSLNLQSLTEEDIDVVVEAFEQSLYTKDVIYEVYEWSKSYLDWLIQDLTNQEYSANYDYDDMINELKVILKTINYIIDKPEFIENITNIYSIIDKFIKDPQGTMAIRAEIKMFFDVVYAVDLDTLRDIFNFLKESKIYNDLVPQLLDNILKPLDVNISASNNPDELNQGIMYAFDLIEIIQNHAYVYNILELLNDLTSDELHHIARVIEFFNDSKGLKHFLHDIAVYGTNEGQLEMDLPFEIIYQIQDWDRELELAQLVIQVVYTYIDEGYIDYDKAWYALSNYNNTVVFEAAFKYAIELLPKVFTMWIAGKDYTYLVGEYVDREIV